MRRPQKTFPDDVLSDTSPHWGALAHQLLREQGGDSANPVIPTIFFTRSGLPGTALLLVLRADAGPNVEISFFSAKHRDLVALHRCWDLTPVHCGAESAIA